MWKYTVEVNGMMCGMCEAHINDAVRKAFPVKKVNSSRSKKQTVVLSETELDAAALADAIRNTGYEVGEIQKEPYKKKGLFGKILQYVDPERDVTKNLSAVFRTKGKRNHHAERKAVQSIVKPSEQRRIFLHIS